MKSVRLKYKDYAFPKNPKSIVITSSKHLSENKINGYRTQTTEICKNPCIITVSGEITQNINEETEKLKNFKMKKTADFCKFLTLTHTMHSLKKSNSKYRQTARKSYTMPYSEKIKKKNSTP